MPIWLMSAVRTAVQVGWGYAATWLLSIGVPAPDDAPAWLTGAALALVTLAVTAIIRWLETRSWGWARGLGRLLMLGVAKQPFAYTYGAQRDPVAARR